MNGYYAIAAALVTFLGLAGLGVSNFGDPGDPVNHPITYVKDQSGIEQDNTEMFGVEQVVEGHTTYVVLMPSERMPPQPPRPMDKHVQCRESQPGSLPAYETCTATVGPIDPPQDDEVNPYSVEEVHAEADVQAAGEYNDFVAKGPIGWLVDLVR